MIGVMFCGVCGHPMYLQRRSDRPSQYYKCARRRHGICGAPLVPSAAIEDMVASGLLDACGDVQMADEVVIPGEDHTTELQAVEEALAHLEDQLVGVQVSPEAWARAVTRLEKRQADLRQMRQVPARSDWVLTGKNFAQTWDDLDETGRRALLVASNVTVGARRLAAPGEQNFSVSLGLSAQREDGQLQLPPDAEDRSDVLILRRDDLEATVRLGNLHRLRQRLAQFKSQVTV
jgi:site-specific DNA recombinase